MFQEVVKVLVLFHNLRVGKTHTRGSRAAHYFFPSTDKTTREGHIKPMDSNSSVDSNKKITEILLNNTINEGDTGKKGE